MRVKVDLRVEIVDGPDAGYVLEEKNRLLDLGGDGPRDWNNMMRPYSVCVDFFVPEYWRLRRPVPKIDESTIEEVTRYEKGD